MKLGKKKREIIEPEPTLNTSEEATKGPELTPEQRSLWEAFVKEYRIMYGPALFLEAKGVEQAESCNLLYAIWAELRKMNEI